jgi:hypothetical protein
LINSCAPPAAVATVNGIAVAICGIVKSFFPAAVNAIFAVGVSHKILNGWLAWFVMAIMAAGVFVCACFVPNDEGEEDPATIKARVYESEADALMD